MSASSRRSAPPAPSVQARLREAIWGAHHRIDHHRLLAPLVRESVTAEDYARALLALYWFHTPLQPQLFEAARHLGGNCFLPANRLAWLRADLVHLEVEPMPPPLQIGHWEGLSAREPGRWAGVLYAVEGSTLGGQMIAGRIAENLGYGPGRGATFFNGFAEGTRARWRRMWECMDQWGISAEDPQVAAGALAVFESLERLLDAAAVWWGIPPRE